MIRTQNNLILSNPFSAVLDYLSSNYIILPPISVPKKKAALELYAHQPAAADYFTALYGISYDIAEIKG